MRQWEKLLETWVWGNDKKKEKALMFSKGSVFSVLSLFGVLFALGLFPQKSIAQEFPTKPITLVIRSGAGGSADVMARLIAKAAEKELGQTIVCESRYPRA